MRPERRSGGLRTARGAGRQRPAQLNPPPCWSKLNAINPRGLGDSVPQGCETQSRFRKLQHPSPSLSTKASPSNIVRTLISRFARSARAVRESPHPAKERAKQSDHGKRAELAGWALMTQTPVVSPPSDFRATAAIPGAPRARYPAQKTARQRVMRQGPREYSGQFPGARKARFQVPGAHDAMRLTAC